jgi:endonuclease YncB( thermonuclease family)
VKGLAAGADASPLRRVLLLFLLEAANVAPAMAAEHVVSGPAHVIDGDTVVIAGGKIRLNGIDAPETDQVCLNAASRSWSCGIEARDRLRARTHSRAWSCSVTGRDKYERWLADCLVEGEDINRWMVRDGWALSFKRYSRRYDADEALAINRRTGVWAGAFIAPWDWRARSRETTVLGALEVPIDAQRVLLSSASEQEAPRADCAIKGNLNRDGACVYHVPGGRFYSRTKIDQAKGERWFCTTEEAEAAGCRRSRQ